MRQNIRPFSLAVVVCVCSTSFAIPIYHEMPTSTLVKESDVAPLVLFGHVQNSRLDAEGENLVDFVIEQVVKSHPVIKGGEIITLKGKRKLDDKSKYLVFFDVLKGDRLDAYRGIQLGPNSGIVQYLRDAMRIKNRPLSEQLRYYFDFLADSETEIAEDAHLNFAKADYKDYMVMAKTLPPDVIAKWLSNATTPPAHYRLYGSLLGHCGTVEHAKLLRSMVQDSIKRKTSDIDGILAGYLMIEPKEAWTYLTNILGDPKNEFGVRYACLRTVSFLWEQRPDLIDRKELTAGLVLVLNQPEMADFGVDYLRKYKCWETTGQVLDLFGKKGYEIPIIKRAILRFALRSPEARAVAFVEQQRKRDAEWVKDIDELLKQERQ